MKDRPGRIPFLLVVFSAAISGCYPHKTRPLNDREVPIIERMSAMIKEVAAKTDDATVKTVEETLSAVVRNGKVRVYSDEPSQPGESAITVMGRVYLHENLLVDDGRTYTDSYEFALEMFFHEGVHLTQSYCTLVFSPKRSEAEADEKTYTFGDYLRTYRKQLYPDEE